MGKTCLVIMLQLHWNVYNVSHAFATTPLRWAKQADKQAAGDLTKKKLPSGLPVSLFGPVQWYSDEGVGDVEYVHCFSSTRSQGFKAEHLGSSLGRWAATVVTYCLNRLVQLVQTFISKPCNRVDEKHCNEMARTCPIGRQSRKLRSKAK